MGREEYYPLTENEAYRGKVKYIGRTRFTYYTSDDKETLKGKVKPLAQLLSIITVIMMMLHLKET